MQADDFFAAVEARQEASLDKPCAEECDHTERPRYTGEPVTVTLVNTLVYTDMANELMTLHAKLARTLLMCGESTESILPHLDRIIELSGGQS